MNRRHLHATTETGHKLPFAFDDDGFLLDPRQWSQEVSQAIADLDGIGPLGPDHWAVIFYLRDHYLNCASLPPLAHLCRTLHLDRHAVHTLFDGCREAWRVAGLPNPGEEAKSYM